MFKKAKRGLSLVLVAFLILPMYVTSVIAIESMTSLTDIEMNDDALKKVYFRLETDKDLASYAVNEEITFKATLWADDVQITTPYVQYAIEFDDGTARKVDYTAMADGIATIKTELTKAGAVKITLYPCTQNKDQIRHTKIKNYTGGAIAGASDIKVTTTEPTDFDAFWQGELAKLDAVSPEIEYIADVSDKLNKEGFKCYEIRVRCVEANVKTLSDTSYVSMFLAIPENASPNTLQLDVSFAGYGVYDPTITAPGSRGMNATLSVYAHSLPLDKESGWYVDHFCECYPEYDHEGSKTKGYGWDYNMELEDNNNPEMVYFRDMFLRDLQAIRFFMKALGDEGVMNTTNDIDTSAWKGLWNGKTIQITGGSQGGMRTIAASALDALSGENSVGITSLKVSVPWFADIADSTATGNIKSSFHPEYKAGLAYFDTALMAKRVEANAVTIGAGTADGKCPMSGVQAVYNNLKVNATLNFIQGKGHDAGASDAVGSADSSQSKIKAGIVSGTVTESGPSDWEFNPDTGVLTISNELTSGWVRLTACTAAGAWGVTIRDMIRHVVVKGRFSKINPGAFDNYPLLETITLPQMNVQFDNNSFANCPKLTEIKITGDAYIPGAVDLSRQTNSETDGHPVNTLADKNAFGGSKSVKTLILNNFYKDADWYRLNKDTLPVNLETIMGPADSTYLREFCAANGYNFVPYGKVANTSTAWTYNEEAKTVTIWGDGAIKELSAADATYLASAENLVINATITELGAKTFAGLTSLKTVTMKGNAPTVPSNAKPFGEKKVTISVYREATGFTKNWCGYKVSTIIFYPGDVNCDEAINAKDAVLLAQYLANWEVKIDDYSADCNGDGKINAKDAVLLAQYLANWDVTLGGDNPPPDDMVGDDNEINCGGFFS